MSLSTPILFLVFNRPETTRQVFEVIKRVRPSKLFIAADGPRSGNLNDEIKCAEVRALFENIDWPCEIKTLFRQSNLGCKYAVSSGITWFFNQVEEGIILEDDILPNLSFFSFCESMLDRYRNEKKVMHISGFNIIGRWKDKIQSYHFSYFGTIWGWATWRRSWQLYDVEIKKWGDPIVQDSLLKTYFPKKYQSERKLLYDRLYSGLIDTWDYQWAFSRLLNHGFSIIPARNMIMNIGFDAHATHTRHMPTWAPKQQFAFEFPIVYQNTIEVDKKYDKKHLMITNKAEQNWVGNMNNAANKTFKLLYSFLRK